MQSSKRKRERTESTIAAVTQTTSARRGSARSNTPVQSKLLNSTPDTIPANKDEKRHENGSKADKKQQGNDPVRRTASPHAQAVRHPIQIQKSKSNGVGESSQIASPPNKPLHVQNQSATGTAGATAGIVSDRQQQMLQALLSHRKLLQLRVQKSRRAAEVRLQQCARSPSPVKPTEVASAQMKVDPSKQMKVDPSKQMKVDPSKQSAKKSPQASSPSPVPVRSHVDREVEAFQALTRRAMQAAKKQKAEEKTESQAVEKRASISLRKGASVGKKMNAALSTLVPGSVVSHSVEARPPQPAMQHAPKTPVTVVSETSTAPQSAAHPPYQQLASQKKLVNPTQLPPNPVSMKTTKVQSQDLQSKQRKPAAQKMMKSSSRSGSSGAAAQLSSLPLHMSINESGLPFNRLAQPNVVLPEALSLRKRRKALQTQLECLYRKKEQSSGAVVQARQSSVEPSVPSELKIDNKFGMGRQQKSSELPLRRKTQWDRVLGEMRWLATDFVEERKWKASSARLLSSAVKIKVSDQSTDHSTLNTKEKPPQKSVKQVATEATSETNIDATGKEKTSTRQETKKDVVSKYAVPSPDDLRQSKQRGAVLADMISKMWEVSWRTQERGRQRDDSLEAHQRFRRQILNEAEEETTMEKQQDAAKNIDDEAQKKQLGSKEVYEALSHRIQSFADRISRRSRQRGRPPKQIGAMGRTLSKAESKAVDFADFMFKGHDGVIVQPSKDIDPFEIVGALIEKDEGPHLVICAPSTTMRWLQALYRTSAERVMLYGPTGGIANPFSSSSSLSSSDVILTEYSCLTTSCDTLALSRFASVAVDWSECSSVSAQEGTKFWAKVHHGITNRKINRVLILKQVSCLSGVGEQERLEQLSSQLAFILGPDLFSAGRKLPSHQLLSWARREVKGSKAPLEEIEGLLEQTFSNYVFSVGDVNDTNKGESEEAGISFELHTCEMSKKQREAYEKCAIDSRGQLSRVGNDPHAAQALLRLRDVCMHAGLTISCGEPFSVSGLSSSSQPDVEQATEFTEKSCKLKDLIEVLKNELGNDFMQEDEKGAAPQVEKKRKSKKSSQKKEQSKAKKVVIITSESYLRITSAFFSSLGLNHDIIGGKCSSVGTSWDKHGKRDFDVVAREASLFLFNVGDIRRRQSASRRPRRYEILLTSLQGIADVSGWAVDMDLAICLDEEWSGRESSLITSLSRKYHSKQCKKWIRLVCANTCEEYFLRQTQTKSSISVLNGCKWARDRKGYFLFDRDDSSVEKEQGITEGIPMFHFPASNILRHQGTQLVSVLCIEGPMPAGLSSGRPLEFLPIQEGPLKGTKKNVQGESLIRELIELEEVKAQIGTENHQGTRYQATDSFPSGILVQHDLFFLSSRYYVERFRRKREGDKPTTMDRASGPRGVTELPQARRSHQSATAGNNTVDSSSETRPAGVIAEELIFYRCEVSEDRFGAKANAAESSLLSLEPRSLNRKNAFAASFSTSRHTQTQRLADGSEGFEPLVYYPPIIPGLEHVAKRAKIDMEKLSPTKSTKSAVAFGEIGGTKRPLPENTEFSSNKRPRVQENAASMFTQYEQPRNMQAVSPAMKPPVATMSKKVHPPAARETPTMSRGLLRILDEDFGMVGIGALPWPKRSRRVADLQTVAPSRTQVDQLLSMGVDDDVPFSQGGSADSSGAWPPLSKNLNGVVLFVKRRPGFVGGVLANAQSSTQSPGWSAGSSGQPSQVMSIGTLPGMPNGLVGDMHTSANQATKKKKKNISHHAVGTTPQGAIAALDMSIRASAANPSGSNAFSKTKDAYRNRASPTQFGRKFGNPGSSLFECPAFVQSIVRLRHKVTDRALSTFSSYGTSKLSLEEAAPSKWVSLVIQGTHDGVGLPSTQLRGPTAKHEVDFGPFNIGLLATPSLAVERTQKTSLGVSLPMGVKVAGRTHLIHPWSSLEESALVRFSETYVKNWQLVARAVSVYNCTTARASRPNARTARQCKEQYDRVLARRAKSGKMAISSGKADSKETFQILSNDTNKKLADEKYRKSIIVSQAHDQSRPMGNHKRSFVAIKKACLRRQNIPAAIPGGAGQESAIVPPHVSHHQALQAAVAMSSGGKVEMWPLQILDLGDKQRAAKASATTATSSSRPHVASGGAHHPSWQPQPYQQSPRRAAPVTRPVPPAPQAANSPRRTIGTGK